MSINPRDLPPPAVLTARLKATTERLIGYLSHSKHQTLRPAIRRLLNQAEQAQKFLKTDGGKEVIKVRRGKEVI